MHDHGPARLLRAIIPRNLLSFGPQTPALSLSGLNVLIGPNGSGKSNLLEALSLVRSAGTDFRPTILKGGGVAEWIWKGQPNQAAWVDLIVDNPKGRAREVTDSPVAIKPIRHALGFHAEQQTFRIVDELIEDESASEGQANPYSYYRFQRGRPVINAADDGERKLSHESFALDLSILAQLQDPQSFPEIAHLRRFYDRIRLYREWTFGRSTVFREPQKADLRNDRLEEDFSNLGLFLNRLRRNPKAKTYLLENLRNLYEGLTDFDVSIEGGTVQVFFTEGEFIIPATRLSDGSIRYLCLLAILLDPDPPPLIGIEEPELGLHPDLLPKVADLLIAASARTQLIVTTHSDILVDALTEHPNAVIVCEKHAGQTTMQRLDSATLGQWLEKYRLGQLWTKGELGGTRW